MPSEHHTIIFVPHARARLRKWRVTSLQIKIFLCSLLALTLAGGYVTLAYFATTVDQADLVDLREENENLHQVNRSFEESIQSLEQQLADYEDRTRQLAIVAGLETASETAGAGIGGESIHVAPETGGYDLLGLESRAGHLSGRLDAVEAKLEERLRWISSTPAITPARGIISSGFGYRSDPVHGSRAFHPGVDIAAAPGQPVRASADGIITRAGRIGGLGRAVYIAHGYGLTSRYGHMSKLAVEPGTKVRRGDVIGYVGNSGRSTGYHLHYEIHLDGKPVNPMVYILDHPSAG